ncbi:MAG: hypothetical protein FWD87_04685 [Spirochaetaceae bacterium]|nr:hypothetical protein [Spirochaetaceae bacterium]
MGLLEKILNKQIQKEKKTYTKSELQSLLKKANQLLSGSDSKSRKKKTVSFDFLIKNFKKNKKNLSVPLDILNIFTEHFDLKKGSLFILNQASENFTVWALTGYDYTTANRLRIPDQDVKEIFGEEKKILSLSDSSLKKIKKYFSSREFANFGSVHLIPFFTENNELFAFLLLSQTATVKAFSNILNCYDVFYPVFNDALLHFFSTIKINPNPAIYIKHSNIYTTIEESIEKYNYSNPFILFFDSNKFLDSVSNIIDKNFKNNFYNNIIDLLSSFVSNNGNIFIIDNNTIFILKDAPALNDKDMLAYQISFFIKNLIPQPFPTGEGRKQASTKKRNTFGEQEIKNLIKVFHLPEENDTLKQFLND